MRAKFLFVALLAISLSLYVSAGAHNAPPVLRSLISSFPEGGLIGASFVAWLIGLVSLLLGALAFCRPGAETSVASEMIVVYGIFGLLSNIAAGVIAAQPALQAAQADWDPSSLLPILSRFSSGLLSAGLAPLVAVVLRGIDTARLNKEDDSQADELNAAHKLLIESINGARTNMTAAAEEFRSTVDKIVASAAQLSTSLEKSVGSADGLEEVCAKLQSIAPSLTQLRDSLSSTATNMGGLQTRTHEAEQMLLALGEAIDKVTNFVRDR